jgi:indole-3-glycerol phosphate synthase
MGSHLHSLIDAHRETARGDTRRFDALFDAAADAPPTRGFRAALEAGDAISVIAEVKRRSPSRGQLRNDLDPATLATSYQLAGAACVSVLTDPVGFDGSVADLVAARAEVQIPVLRKDFTVSVNDVCDTRLMGADCVLLIVAALDDAELADFAALAAELELDALIEVHDEHDLDRALTATTGELIGVNQRDLVTFDVDHGRAARLAAAVPEHTTLVAESGIRHHRDVVTAADAGYHAVLVGEHLVTAADPAAALRRLRGDGR